MSKEKSLAELVKEKQKIEEEKKSEKLKTPKKLTTPREILTNDINIDYEWLAKNSNFQRLWIELIKHQFPNQFKEVNTRTKGKVMINQFNRKLKEVNETLDIIEKLKKGKKGDYTGVIDEFKNKLLKIRGMK